MKVVNVHEAKATLPALLKRVLAGEKVVITRNNKPIAELTALKDPLKPRTPGWLKGKMKLLQDWETADKEVSELMTKSSPTTR